jgi:hypothetical protein
MSTLLVNNIKSYTGTTVTISGSNISVTGNTTLGDSVGTDNLVINGHVTASGNISASGTIFADRFDSATGGAAIDFNDSVEVQGAISASGIITGSDGFFPGTVTAGGLLDSRLTASFNKISTNLIPSVDNGKDIGSTSNEWRNLFIDGLASIDLAEIDSVSSSLIPNANDAYDLGSTTFAWSKLFVDEVFMTGSTRAFYDTGTKRLTLGATNTFTGNVSASGIVSGSNVAGRFLVSGATGSFGLIQSLNNGLGLKINGDTLLGNASGDTHVITGHVTASGNISSSGTITANKIESDQLVGHVGDANTGLQFASDTVIIEANDVQIGKFASTFINLNKDISNNLAQSVVINDSLKVNSDITASAAISASGVTTALGFNTHKVTGASQDLASSAIYSVNGRKVEVKAITAASISDGAFASFTLFNTSIAADSIVLGSFTGGTAGPITGSILTAATINASTASVQIHNETGQAVSADAGFTASFVIL